MKATELRDSAEIFPADQTKRGSHCLSLLWCTVSTTLICQYSRIVVGIQSVTDKTVYGEIYKAYYLAYRTLQRFGALASRPRCLFTRYLVNAAWGGGRKHISKLGECKRFLFRETLTIHVDGVVDDWSPIAPYISVRCETQARRVFFCVALGYRFRSGEWEYMVYSIDNAETNNR